MGAHSSMLTLLIMKTVSDISIGLEFARTSTYSDTEF